MKKRAQLIFGSILLVGLMSFTLSSSDIKNDSTQSLSEILDCQHGQCKATAKSTGNRCKHCVSNSGDQYCYQHK